MFLISAQNIDCGYSLGPPRRFYLFFFFFFFFQFLQVKFSINLNRRVFVMGSSYSHVKHNSEGHTIKTL